MDIQNIEYDLKGFYNDLINGVEKAVNIALFFGVLIVGIIFYFTKKEQRKKYVLRKLNRKIKNLKFRKFKKRY